MKNRDESLIISAAHHMTWLQRLSSRLLTLLWWLLWIYLWLPALAVACLLIWGEQLLPVEVRLDQLPGHLEVLGRYAFFIGLFGGGLVLWSRINYWRFSGEEQRSAIGDVTLEEIATDQGLPAHVLEQGRNGKIVIVHHDAQGGIHHLDIIMTVAAGPVAPPEPGVSNASQLGQH